MTEHTPHQKKVIGRYYRERDRIMLTRLGEIVTELYLADTEAKVNRLWGRADKAMKTLQVPASIAEHILTERNPEILARNLREWQQADGPRANNGDKR